MTPAATHAPRTVYAGGRVFDGTGADPFRADIVVAAGRIVDVGTDLDGDVAIDCAGCTLLPGLIDCHVHVTFSGPDLLAELQRPFSYQFYEAAVNLRRTLDAGITTVRDAGGADLGVQVAVDNGLIAGPRMQIAVSIISQTGGHGDGWLPSGVTASSVPHPGRPDAVVDGPDGMRKVARQLMRAGAEVLKVCTTGGVLSARDDPRHSQFSPAELAVLVAEADMQGRYVMAHAQGTAGIKNAIRAGVRSIEHGIYLDDEAISMMLANGTFLVPTLAAPRAVIAAAAAGAAIPEVMVDKARGVALIHAGSVRRAVDAGVKIAMGTDSGVGPHGDNLTELPLMAAAGMSPARVLAATTSVAAELLGWGERVGRVAEGFLADLVVVDGDPYDLTALPGTIRTVIKGGMPVRDRT